ncbi:MAG: aminoacyl-tRNA deacylase [Rhodospirillales bacterium CG15_BIG_FIL_POST_REV_8_21_14_020_66_15]|nr:MAG: aminoacyl-tRNA deacylase [Rhodospirillales bacterium CG15_BIG_FIL_POST_REV_8_21_14_020_66_15]
MAFKTKQSVQRVIQALKAAGLGDRVIELTATAKTAEDAARAVGAGLGQIVKSLTFLVGDREVLALVAGDHTCKPEALPRVLDLEGKVSKPQAQRVKDVTGFTIGGVSPVGLESDMPIAIDASLRRFDRLYAAAGHPHCLFPVTFDELKRLTGGIVSYNIAEAIDPDAVEMPRFRRTRTFLEKTEQAG